MKEPSITDMVRRSIRFVLSLLALSLITGVVFSTIRYYAFGFAIGLTGSVYCLISGARQAEAVATVALGGGKGKPVFGAMSRMAVAVVVTMAALWIKVSLAATIAGLFAWLAILIYLTISKRKE